MKKRFVSACMAGLLAVSLAGCGGAGNSSAEAAKTSAEESKTEAATTAAESSETSTEAASEASESSAEGTFTVGFDQDFPPMGFVGDDGEYTGFDLELAQEVASRLGLEYVPQPIAWDAKDMELEAGTIDCIWNGFTMNGREDAYTWSDGQQPGICSGSRFRYFNSGGSVRKGCRGSDRLFCRSSSEGQSGAEQQLWNSADCCRL